MMAKIRIAFVAHQANLSGAARMLWQTLKYLDKSTFEVLVISDKSGAGLEQYKRYAPVRHFDLQNVRITSRGQRFQRRFWKFFQKYWYQHLLKNFQPDCIYFNTNGAPHLMQWSSKIPCPKICHIHGYNQGLTYADFFNDGRRAPVDRFAIDTTMSVPDHYIACSNASRDTLTSVLGVRPCRLSVIQSGIDVDELLNHETSLSRQALGWGNGDIIVGAVGLFSYLKGADLFIEAARVLKSRYKNRKLRFVWLGGDMKAVFRKDLCYMTAFGQKMKSLIREYKVESDVNLMGQHKNIYDYVRLLDLFVLPSRDEGLPLSLLEGMRFKIPTVATSVGGIPEVIRQDAGILVEPNSVKALADGIARALDDPQQSRERAQVAFQRVGSEFSIAKQIKRTEEVIKKVVDNYATGFQ